MRVDSGRESGVERGNRHEDNADEDVELFCYDDLLQQGGDSHLLIFQKQSERAVI